MTALARKARHPVGTAFDRAQDYDVHARVQGRIADALADRIASLPIIAARGEKLRLLEIGCGTGFLTRALRDRGLDGRWLVTDIAPRMVSRCAAAMGDSGHKPTLTFVTLDGETPGHHLGEVDLICSSMAFQWFGNLRSALGRLAALLAPGGVLAFSTLLDGTFSEWEQAHHAVGVDTGGLCYPDLELLSGLFPPRGNLTIGEMHVRDAYPNAAMFLQGLKRIGAGTPRSDHRPLSPAALRRVMTAFNAAGATVTYRVALCNWTSPSAKDELRND
ncbi:methyltransferase domain-containing protein [Novosphingobium sp. G106]|uniref:methyltransferase n=1 Tax=Novosphingobium sp. G106 TaxID=2849500 RepID=UPI001C2D1E7D|nr:methyltransferase [Novosphingobium sp. G106]MBV1689500.1 methyltransferase domain-containing protein [Novosphingobium sp. G106]